MRKHQVALMLRIMYSPELLLRRHGLPQTLKDRQMAPNFSNFKHNNFHRGVSQERRIGFSSVFGKPEYETGQILLEK